MCGRSSTPLRKIFFLRSIAAEAIQEYTGRLRQKDGSDVIVEMNVRVVRDPKGAVRYFEGFVNDVTERVRGEETVRQTS